MDKRTHRKIWEKCRRGREMKILKKLKAALFNDAMFNDETPIESQAEIIKQTIENIQTMTQAILSYQEDIENLRHKNNLVENEILAMQNAISNHLRKVQFNNQNDIESESSESESAPTENESDSSGNESASSENGSESLQNKSELSMSVSASSENKSAPIENESESSENKSVSLKNESESSASIVTNEN